MSYEVIRSVKQLKVGMKVCLSYNKRWIAVVKEIFHEPDGYSRVALFDLKEKGGVTGCALGEFKVLRQWVEDGSYKIASPLSLRDLKRVKKTSLKPVYAYMEEMK